MLVYIACTIAVFALFAADDSFIMSFAKARAACAAGHVRACTATLYTFAGILCIHDLTGAEAVCAFRLSFSSAA